MIFAGCAFAGLACVRKIHTLHRLPSFQTGQFYFKTHLHTEAIFFTRGRGSAGNAMTSKDSGKKPSKDDANPEASGEAGASSNATDDAAEALKRLRLQELVAGKQNETKPQRNMESHKFWQTQPVPHFNEAARTEEGPIEPEDVEKIRKEPYPLIDGFEWVTMDLNQQSEIDDVYQLLYQNYVEDDEAMFRFKYSSSFLNWALKSPGWKKDWHVGIRASTSRKLVAFISGVPITIRIRSQTVKCSEINFLCVHKKLRSKRLAPVLIREITRRCNLANIWQAIYTGGIVLPTAISTCRYFHRSINWKKLYEVGFSPLPPGSTQSRQITRYKLPDKTSVKGLRPMEVKDIDAVLSLLKRYLDKHDLAQEFDMKEGEHWFLNTDTSSPDKVVFSYVVENDGTITDFFSFYNLESTVIGNEKHDSIKAAYSYYYATETGMQGDSKSKAALKKRLNELMNDALILAKKENFDVFNALTLLDNPLFLQEQKFGPGDGRLHYYLYNYRTAPIPGGIDGKGHIDDRQTGGIGVVML